MSPDSPSQEEQDAMAAEWAAALAEASAAPAASTAVAEEVAPEQVSTPSFANFTPTTAGGPAGDINMILDIPVQLTVELGRTKVLVKDLLQLNQGSVLELGKLAGELLDVFVNQKLVARGEAVVVNEKFGVRLVDIISPAERVEKLV